MAAHHYRVISLLPLAAVLSDAAHASERMVMNYDSAGRLISVDTRTDGLEGFATEYGLSGSGNRVDVQESVVVGDSWLESGSSLTPGQSILSSDARFRLAFGRNATLALYDQRGRVVWSTPNYYGAPAKSAQMMADGNFVLYDDYNRIYYATGTSGNAGAHLSVQVDGNVVVYSSTEQPLWSRF